MFRDIGIMIQDQGDMIGRLECDICYQSLSEHLMLILFL